jgi:hypothetical protein
MLSCIFEVIGTKTKGVPQTKMKEILEVVMQSFPPAK